ncbi:MAG: flagellar basal-body rod protein FlgG [bacterium]
MMRSLWTAATGMAGQQFNLDTIANNLANVNTAGFKKSRVDFEDLIYEVLKSPGTPITTGSVLPTGIHVGHGVAIAGTQKIHSLGNLQETQNPLDIAIEGEGFFQLLLPDGSTGYTRDGSFKMDQEGKLVTSNGHILQPEIVIPPGTTQITITEDGTVSVIIGNETKTPQEVGTIQLVRFASPAGLNPIGKNVFKDSAASGDPITGTPGREGFGRLEQNFLELSNVNIVDEMVNMIIAQRAYELNSKAIQTGDAMLGIVGGLKR